MTKVKDIEIREDSQIPPKNPEDSADNSVFPENYIMNEWSYDPRSRNSEFHFDRSRETLDMASENDSDYYIPREWWPEGFQIAFMAEYVLGAPQADNLRKRQRKGWVFVHEDEIPQLKTQIMNHEFDQNRRDPWIRMGGHILMKKPETVYLEEQEKQRRIGEEVRRQSEATTAFLNGGRDPRYIVESRQSYQPAHRMRIR